MKRIWIGALALLLMLLPLLSSCGGAMQFVENGVYQKGKTTYYLASANYVPRAYLASAKVGTLKRANMDVVDLYEINGSEDETWICDKDLTMLFYAEGAQLPTLSEMRPTALHLQMSDVLSLGLGTIEDVAEIQKVVDAYTSGVSFLWEDVEEGYSYDRYEILFSSAQYPAFYYSLVYLRYSEDLCLYEAVEDPTSFTPSYPGVQVTTEEYHYNVVENGVMVSKVEHLAVYHFGRDIVLDMETGRCYRLGSDRLGQMADSYRPEDPQ